MFGELIGLCLAQAWLDQGAPAPFTLAELGPGRGTLMADVLRATARVPGLSCRRPRHAGRGLAPPARASSARRWATIRPNGSTALDDLPEAPLFLVANEFFDALPIRQFLRHPQGWRERLVGAARTAASPSACRRPRRLPRSTTALPTPPPGDVVEHLPRRRRAITAAIAPASPATAARP